ncbi:NERD domain-containing protein [Bacillus altitudinis]|uniref:NERD domain-containing protein n=1 Tax=Bacillus altitudinis TaxID=293387 RepID=UPI0010720145|nr:NERD domain-containing protein [Bacillus altitudinis]QEO60777.1 NERD domain-containing protein [Bacillus altitudinis]
MIKHFANLATYSDLFGTKKTREEIIELIRNLPLLSSFILLSQISTGVYKDEELKNHLVKNCYNHLNHSFKNNPPPSFVSEKVYSHFLDKIDILKRNFVFSPQSILTLWKWILAYGDKSKFNDLQSGVNGLSTLSFLTLMTNDYLTKDKFSKEELNAEIFSNMVFNNQENILNAISRAVIIYTEIAIDRELFSENEFVDINSDFFDKYGFTIKEHISIIFGLLAAFMQPKDLGEKWLQNIDEIFSQSRLQDLSKEILTALTIDFDSISTWAKNKIDSFWDYQELKIKPLLMVNEKQFLTFSTKLLQEQVFTGLYHKVRHIYPENDKRFMDFYGKPFEKYAQNLVKDALKQTKLKYKFINEFRYKGTKDSPDIMIRLGDKLLAIEVKSYRLLLSSITDANIETINNDTNKLIINPLKQVHDRVKELIELDHCSVKGINEIYLMVVTQGNYPTLKPYEDLIEGRISKHFSLDVKSYFHLDIEEFEMLCLLLSRKRPIFKVLNNKDQHKYHSFKNFVFNNSYHIKRLPMLDKEFQKAIAEIQSILFGD